MGRKKSRLEQIEEALQESSDIWQLYRMANRVPQLRKRKKPKTAEANRIQLGQSEDPNALENQRPHIILEHAREALEKAYAFLPSIYLLRSGNAEAIDQVIEFCKAESQTFRSGYVKSQLFHELKRLSLTPTQIESLKEIALQYILAWNCRNELTELGRLMIKHADANFVVVLFDHYQNHSRQLVREKAGSMLYRILNSRPDLQEFVKLSDVKFK